jgi:endo-1,4-beta-xylanase
VSVNAWTGGFVATVRVTAGAAGTSSWNVGLTLPAGATVTSTWNANRTGTGGTLQFANVSHNGRLGGGQATEFGFQGTGTPGTMVPACSSS